MKAPKISMEEIINYAHIGGHSGHLDKFALDLPDDMHCYSQFLYFLETNLIGLNGSNSVGFDRVKKMNGKECSAYFQGRVDHMLDEIMRTCFNDKAIKNKKIEIPQESLLSRSALSPHVINYILRINGYKIEGDYSATKDLSTRSSYSIKRSSPALKETIVESYFKTLGVDSPIDFAQEFQNHARQK